MPSIKRARTLYNERKTNCKKRYLVLGWQKKNKKREKKTKRGFLPLAGLLGAAAGPILGQIARPLLKTFIGGRRRR